MRTARIEVELIEESGNVFYIIAKTAKALRRAGQAEKADEYQERALNSESYDAVLTLTAEYVDII